MLKRSDSKGYIIPFTWYTWKGKSIEKHQWLPETDQVGEENCLQRGINISYF